MKNKFALTLFLLIGGIAVSLSGYSQDTTTAGQDIKAAANKTGDAVEKTAVKVGDKTAQIAASTKAVIVDKVYEGKVSPGGHRVYINSHAKYYWIDKKGHKHFITEAALKNKK